MFRSLKSCYTLRCLLQVARGYKKELVTIQQVAKSEKIMEPSVAKFLRQLRMAGFIRSVRGAGGGYEITRSPSTISVYEVLSATSKRLPQESFCTHTDSEQDTPCNLRDFWQVSDTWAKIFWESVSLQDLLTNEFSIGNHTQSQVENQLEIMRAAICKSETTSD